MELLEMMMRRRSIRKYQSTKVEREKLNKIQTAGLYAPNPGGRQGARIIMLDDAALIDRIGVVNADCENRNWDRGVSAEQPSIIDDRTIRSGFYSCPALGIVFVPEAACRTVNGIGSAFVCAENMVLEAYELGVASCIVGRAEATFIHPKMRALIRQWGLEGYEPVVFICLGYVDGPYPEVKPREPGRALFAGGA